MTATAAIRQSWVITLRDLKHWQREPWAPIFGIAFSIMLLLVFGYLFGGAIELPGGGDYLPYLLPGMFALSMMFGIETTMTAIAQDTKRGITDRFRSLPISSVAVPLGRAGADLLNSAVQLAVLMVGGLLVGWRIDDGARPRTARGRRCCCGCGSRCCGSGSSSASRSAARARRWPCRCWSGRSGSCPTCSSHPRRCPTGSGSWPSGTRSRPPRGRCRELFGNPTGITDGVLADHAVLLAFAVAARARPRVRAAVRACLPQAVPLTAADRGVREGRLRAHPGRCSRRTRAGGRCRAGRAAGRGCRVRRSPRRP